METLDSPSEHSNLAARWAVVAVLLFSFAAAYAAWRYNTTIQQRPLALWGSDRARTFVHAERMDLDRLEPGLGGESQPTLTIGEQLWHAVETRDVTAHGGFIYIRHGIVNDRAFDWDAKIDPALAQWRYAIRAQFADDRVTLLVDPERGWIHMLEANQSASIGPIAAGFKQLCEEPFQSKSSK